MVEKETFLKIIDDSIEKGKSALVAIGSNKVKEIHNVVSFLHDIRKDVDSDIIPERYCDYFKGTITNSISPMFLAIANLFSLQSIENLGLERIIPELDKLISSKDLSSVFFNYEFFTNLGFFETNIVAIGANGSGKTSLTSKLKETLSGRTAVVISAQKILIIPTFGGISNYNNTSQQLVASYGFDKQNRVTYDVKKEDSIPYSYIKEHGSEFKILLDNLLAERSAIRNQFLERLQAKEVGTDDVPKTKLDRAIEIWNFLINNCKMACSDGINITISEVGQPQYPAHQMSDGEKVILFHIAQILQAPQGGFIVVDEPEMYLHKTILCKLWDTLEQERPDCLFVYLSHDLEFASSRTSAQKVWIKSYKHPSKWEIERIPENEIPEELLMRILGSRRTVLFCEGQKSKSLDPTILEILFPYMSILPVDTCKNVISYTKAFNKISNTNIKAIGLVDSDFRTHKEVVSLNQNNIYTLNVSEIENILLSDNFLYLFSTWIRCEEKSVDELKKLIMEKFESDKELQVCNTISSRIQHVFTTSHIGKGNTKDEVTQKLKDFSDNIDIETWHNETTDSFDEVIRNNDYNGVIQKYNNKGLFTCANKIFNIGNFQERALQFLKESDDAKSALRQCFPTQVQNENNAQKQVQQS